METTTTTTAKPTGQVLRALTTALCAAAFVVMMAFGGPDEQGSRWDADVDAHSDVSHEVALATTTTDTVALDTSGMNGN